MAVGYLSRSASQSEISTFFPNMRQQRRNGMAYIFSDQSTEDITYLKRCYLKRAESCSSMSDIDTGSDSDKEVGLFDTACGTCGSERFDASHSDITEDSDNSDDVESMDCDDDISVDAGRPVVLKRRFALADIFEGVPDSEVNEFLAKYSNSEETCDNETFRQDQRLRRFAMANIFEGFSGDVIEQLLGNHIPHHNDTGTNGLPHPDETYLSRRRNALADIFQNIINDELKARLAGQPDDGYSLSDSSDDQIDIDDSDSLTGSDSSDSSHPDEHYLWRRRCALANIFEDIGASGSYFRAQ